MKPKIKISLVILTVTILAISSIILYTNTREEKQLNENHLKEEVKENIGESKNDEQLNVTDVDGTKEKEETTKEDSNKKDEVISSSQTNEDDKKQNNTSTPNDNSSNVTPEQNNSNTGNQENTNKNEEKEETNVSQNNTTNTNETKQEEVVTPQVDEEYERLKKIYKYPDGITCDEAALKASMIVYNENYSHSGCISGSYKGQLVGYRIIIYFNDGTSMYYDGAID